MRPLLGEVRERGVAGAPCVAGSTLLPGAENRGYRDPAYSDGPSRPLRVVACCCSGGSRKAFHVGSTGDFSFNDLELLRGENDEKAKLKSRWRAWCWSGGFKNLKRGEVSHSPRRTWTPRVCSLPILHVASWIIRSRQERLGEEGRTNRSRSGNVTSPPRLHTDPVNRNRINWCRGAGEGENRPPGSLPVRNKKLNLSFRLFWFLKSARATRVYLDLGLGDFCT